MNNNKSLGNNKKPGRTLLVKVDDSFNNSVFKNLVGLSTQFLTEKTQSYFLTFDSIESSTAAYDKLSQISDLKVKYAHYRIFFTMKELNDDSDYSKIRQEHMDYINKNTGANVLYYKLYKKNSSFIGCGDLTLDTKDGFDKLMDSDSGFKEFSFSEYSGVHYRYNRRSNNSSTNHDI